MGALLGGIAGGMKDKSKQTSDVLLSAEQEQERLGREISTDQLKQLRDLISAGPGQSDVEGALTSQQNLAALFERMQETGAIPSQADFQRGRDIASEQFKPQQVAFEQALRQEREQTARLAGQLGRSQDDPILRAKLAQARAEGTERIQASQQAFASQIAQQSPLDRLNFAQQATQLRSGLATQALQNRQTLLGLGSQLQQAGRQFRVSTASQISKGESGGGLKGAITGAIGTIGAFSQMASGFGGLLGGMPSAGSATSSDVSNPLGSMSLSQRSGFSPLNEVVTGANSPNMLRGGF